jgi:hypothetical protein
MNSAPTLQSLEQKLSKMEKENLELKNLVTHLNRSFALQQYESRVLTMQLANNVSNLTNMALDIKQTFGRNNERDQNSTGRLDEMERVVSYLKAQLRSSAVSSIDMERRADEMNSSMMLLNTTILNLQKGQYSVIFTPRPY